MLFYVVYFYGFVVFVGGLIGIWMGGVFVDGMGFKLCVNYVCVLVFVFLVVVLFFIFGMVLNLLMLIFFVMIILMVLFLVWFGLVFFVF